MFRARHGYKEAHAHDKPYRRNRDFKIQLILIEYNFLTNTDGYLAQL